MKRLNCGCWCENKFIFNIKSFQYKTKLDTTLSSIFSPKNSRQRARLHVNQNNVHNT